MRKAPDSADTSALNAKGRVKVIGAKDFLNDTPTGKFSMEISYVKPSSIAGRDELPGTGFYQ